MANVISHSVAVGLVAAGASWDRKSSRQANSAYKTMMNGLMARQLGLVGKTHTAEGHPIARSLAEVKSWFAEVEKQATKHARKLVRMAG